MNPDFLLYFNKKRQWVAIYFWDTHPNTFESWGGGRWAYYQPSNRNGTGLFGEMHFVKSRVREDVFDHEKMHLLGDILRSKGLAWSTRNEEWLCNLSDSLTRQFWRNWRKL